MLQPEDCCGDCRQAAITRLVSVLSNDALSTAMEFSSPINVSTTITGFNEAASELSNPWTVLSRTTAVEFVRQFRDTHEGISCNIELYVEAQSRGLPHLHLRVVEPQSSSEPHV